MEIISQLSSCPHCEDPTFDDHTCTHRLLFVREALCGVDNEWANLVDRGSVQGLNLLTTVQSGSMEAGFLSEHLFKTLVSPRTTGKSMLHI